MLVLLCVLVAFACAGAITNDADDGRIDGFALSQIGDVPLKADGSNFTESEVSSVDASCEVPWQQGKCTAYDPVSIGYSGLTASGTYLSDSIYTVAAPVENRELLGKRVELSYNGITIIAVVSDLGEFAPYGVAFDFAPAVFHAFGAQTASDWGAHTVSYRFVD